MTQVISLEKLANDSRVINLNATVSSEGFADALPNFFTDVKSFISDLFTVSKSTSPGALDTHGFFGSIKQIEYTKLMPVPIHMPMGFNGNVVHYIDVLEKAQGISEKLISDVLNPFSIWIALNISDPTRLAQLTSDRGIHGLRFHDIAGVTKEIGQFIDTNSGRSEVTFGSAFRRVGDWSEAVKQFNDLNNRANRLNNTDITNMVASISNNLDELLKRIKEEPDTYRISGTTVKVISTMCFTMAKECEFYAAYRHMLANLQVALLDSEKILKEFIKDTAKVSKD
jgi:hypothetical protein